MSTHTRNLLLLPVLLGLTLTGCSGTWRKAPAEPIVEVETVQVPIDLPRRPVAIPNFQTSEEPVVVTNITLPELLKRAEEGEVFEHFAISAGTWEKIKEVWLNAQAYIDEAEAYFDDVEEQVNKKEGGN